MKELSQIIRCSKLPRQNLPLKRTKVAMNTLRMACKSQYFILRDPRSSVTLASVLLNTRYRAHNRE